MVLTFSRKVLYRVSVERVADPRHYKSRLLVNIVLTAVVQSLHALPSCPRSIC